MEVLCDSCKERVELMVDLMHFIQRRIQMERSMRPIEKEVFNKVDNKDLSEYLPKARKIFEPQPYS